MTGGGSLLPGLVVGLLVASVLSVPLARRLGYASGYVLSAAVSAGLIAVALQTPTVLAGRSLDFAAPWLSSIGVRFAFRLDGLALVFTLLVLAVGALVLAYCPSYAAGAGLQRPGRFYAAMMLFAAGMVGLVLAADGVLLYVFWELTTVSSFALIDHRGDTGHRRAADRALLITVVGGLCLLAAVLLAGTTSGTMDVGTWARDPARLGGALGVILPLVVLAAATKSAQLPFHVWLPDAMVAPTPVSAYLHAAAMVKAGIYLLARLAPLFEPHPGWRALVVAVGLSTAVFAAAVALTRDDLKALLAYSTVSQLGLMVALLGVGTFEAVAAALLHAIAHAAYKSSLFLATGAIERRHGTRDLRRLSGLSRSMPAMATALVLAVASTAGLPPLLGYASKEEAFSALLHGHGPLTIGLLLTAAAAAAVALTVAYSLRVAAVAFGGGPVSRREAPGWMLVATGVPAVAGLALGVVVSRLSASLAAASGDATGHDGHLDLGLWHGATGAFWASLAATGAGVVVFALSDLSRRWAGVLPDGRDAVEAVRRWLRQLGDVLARPLMSPAPAVHLAVVLVVAAVAVAGAWVHETPVQSVPATDVSGQETVLALLLTVACVGVAGARDRLAAVAVLGTAGFLVAALYVLHGAPDLVLAQLLVDALLVALIVFVFRRMPREHPEVARPRRIAAAAVGGLIGLVAGATTFVLGGGRELSPVAGHYLHAATAGEAGGNAVNAVLTDFRALDTLGEITVLATAAVGVVALVGAYGRERDR
ncbi:MAG TPA: hydrogen gas-evolving membrane-bound hydrogenase subunit E [Nitriliruptorales bacterium]|nr:hydrogen gas-evolving membrane-bound hydrogenase subunit E [Nitriliruptorales bacterium]